MDFIESAQTGICYLLAGYTAWRFLLTSIGSLSCAPFAQRIQSSEELERIVQKEAETLHLGKITIDSGFDFEGKLDLYDARAAIQKLGEKYKLLVEPGRNATRKVIKHELYHLKKGHLERKPKNIVIDHFDYLFRREVQAVLYGTFGLKL